MTGLLGLCSCGSPSSDYTDHDQNRTQEQDQAASGVSWTDLTDTGSMELSYARNFSVDEYENGYKLLTTMDETQLFVVPEDAAGSWQLPWHIDKCRSLAS